MKKNLEDKRDRVRTHLRTEYIKSVVRQKRRQAIEISEYNEKKFSQLDRIAEEIDKLQGKPFDMMAVDSILEGLRRYQTESLNNPKIIGLLVHLSANIFQNHLEDQLVGIMEKVRICLNSFLASPDPIVQPYLQSLVPICRHSFMVPLYYNLSLIKYWGDLTLKEVYFGMFLNILESSPGLLLGKSGKEIDLENFLLDDLGFQNDISLRKVIWLVNRELGLVKEIEDEQIKYIQRIVQQTIVSEENAKYFVDNGQNIIELVLEQQKYSSSDYIKLLGLQILDRLFRYPSVSQQLFKAHDLLPMILKKRLSQHTLQQSLLTMSSILTNLINFGGFIRILIQNEILDQLISLAYSTATKIRHNIRFQFKKVLLNLAVLSNDRDRVLLVANNLTAVIADIIRKESDTELMVLALKCFEELMVTDQRLMDEEDSDWGNKSISREFLAKYNLKPYVERLCDHPHTEISEYANTLMDQYLEPKQYECIKLY